MLVNIPAPWFAYGVYLFFPPINPTVFQVINLAIDSGLHLQKESQIWPIQFAPTTELFITAPLVLVNSVKLPDSIKYVDLVSYQMAFKQICWLVVSNMNFIFGFIWDVILSIDELIFFKIVIAPPTRYPMLWNMIYIYIYIYIYTYDIYIYTYDMIFDIWYTILLFNDHVI